MQLFLFIIIIFIYIHSLLVPLNNIGNRKYVLLTKRSKSSTESIKNMLQRVRQPL